MKTLRIKQLALISVFFLIACQEDSLVEEIDPVDEDMIAATLLADDYYNESGGRIEKGEPSITVLKYQDGNIYFNTNTDDVDEYQLVTETTVTAYVEPGEFIFWYRGEGLDDLEAVDFDEDAKAYLEQLPDEYQHDLMWVLKMPDSYDPDHKELKYDIVYESTENPGEIIRLDPKIGSLGGGSAADDGSDGDSVPNEG